MSTLYYLSVILFSGLLFGRAASCFRLPTVTGYLIAGLIAGPSLLGLVPANIVSQMGMLSEVALGIIAFDIGSQFSIRHLKKLGSSIILLTISQAFGAALVILFVMQVLLKQDLAFSLVLASIGTATAPAATLLVIKQYRAAGPVVDTLLPVVAIDDAIGIMLFSISAAIATSLKNPAASASFTSAVFEPVGEIALALLLGLLLGLILSLAASKISVDGELLVLSVGTIFMGAALADAFHLSALIVCMTTGATITNLIDKSRKIFSLVENFVPPIYLAFFTLSGAELNPALLGEVGFVGFSYILARSVGKVTGAYLGSKMLHMPESIQKYLGITLLPQAGVAIGLSVLAQSILPDYANTLSTIVLSATLIYELIGPLLTKIALTRAGEINLPEE